MDDEALVTEVKPDAADKADGESSPPAESLGFDKVAWLASLPIRTQIDDPTIFDADARLWQRCQPLVRALAEVYQPTSKELKRSAEPQYSMPTFKHYLAGLIGMTDPSHWEICPRCQGTCLTPDHKNPCLSCEGAGYVPRHDGRRLA